MQKKAFISTQGPLAKTIPDFWRMVWLEKTVVIVMTTRTVERCRQKCAQYWPLEEQMEEDYGSIHVRNLGLEVSPDYVITRLLVTDAKVGIPVSLAPLTFCSRLAGRRERSDALVVQQLARLRGPSLGDCDAGLPTEGARLPEGRRRETGRPVGRSPERTTDRRALQRRHRSHGYLHHSGHQ